MQTEKRGLTLKHKERVGYYIIHEFYECSKCGGNILFERDRTPGFCSKDWYPCQKCGYDMDKEG